MKSVRIWSYPGPYFPAFGLNTDRNNSEYGYFLRRETLLREFIKGLDHSSAFYVINVFRVLLGSSHPVLATLAHINSETNPPPLIINVVCKYLSQFVGASFGVATLPICCNVV